MRDKLSVHVESDLARQRVLIKAVARQGGLCINKTYEFTKSAFEDFHPGVADLFADTFQRSAESKGIKFENGREVE